jgi:hypothetical protein
MPKTPPKRKPKPAPKRRNQRGLDPIALPFEEAVRRLLCTKPSDAKPKKRKKPA